MYLFLLYSQYKLSVVSVAFDFNVSPNDVAPVSPILFPVYVKRKKSELLMDVIGTLIVFTTQIDLSNCYV